MFVIAQATVHMKRLLSIAIIAFISIGLLEIGTRLIYLALFDANYDHNHQKAKVLKATASNATFNEKDKLQ